MLAELTVKVFRKESGGKKYVLRNVQTADISSHSSFGKFVVRVFGSKFCGEIKDMEIGYFKGNKRVWIHTNDDYLDKLRSWTAITLWREGVPGRKRVVYEHSDSDSDDGTQRNSTS